MEHNPVMDAELKEAIWRGLQDIQPNDELKPEPSTPAEEQASFQKHDDSKTVEHAACQW